MWVLPHRLSLEERDNYLRCDKEDGAARNSEQLISGEVENIGIRMHHKRAKSARSASGVVVFVFCLLVIPRIVTPVEAGVPKEEQLVAFYQATAQKSLFQRDRWIVEAREQTTIEYHGSKKAAPRYVYKYSAYRDRDRLDSRMERTTFLSEDNDRVKKRYQYLILGGRLYSYIKMLREGEQASMVIASNDLSLRVLNSAGSKAKALAGYMLGDSKPLAKILTEESSVLHTRPSMQMVNGFPTYVLEATTPYGHYTVWMDPNCGYSPRRVIVERGPKDLYGGKAVSTPPRPPIPGARRVNPLEHRPTRERARFVLDILKIKEIGGDFFATEGAATTIHVYDDGSIEEFHSVCERILVDLDPDFNDIPDAFVLDVPDGTRVFDVDFPAGKFKWQNGKMVSLIIEPISLLGKPLPELKDLKFDLSSADANDKMMLVCFWDMEQRPSRNCIRELAKRAGELKEKGVTIVAIQASKVDENKLDEWIKKNNIPFAAGVITADIEKTRFVWGVRSLPWLILTDKQHVVTAEGFNPAELDEKLGKNSKH